MKRTRLRSWLLFAAVVLFALTAHAGQRGPVNIIAGSGTTVTPTPINASGQYEWTVAATGAVSSVFGSAPITCSPTTGAVACSLTTPLSVLYGGTGDAILGAHSVLVGEGTGAVASVACANALPLVGNTGADPGCAVLTAPGGGTGVASPTAHTLQIAEGASAFASLGPCGAGLPVVGVAGADPTCAFALGTVGGGTGLTTAGTTGNVLTSSAGSWFSAAPESNGFLTAYTGASGVSVPATLGQIAVTSITSVTAGHIVFQSHFDLTAGGVDVNGGIGYQTTIGAAATFTLRLLMVSGAGTGSVTNSYCLSINSSTTCTSPSYNITANSGSGQTANADIEAWILH